MASELKMASAFVLDRRSPISSSVDRGRPNDDHPTRPKNRPIGVRGTLAAGLAIRCLRPM